MISSEKGDRIISLPNIISDPLPDAGDELLGDSYDINEIEDGFFYEVEGKVRLGFMLQSQVPHSKYLEPPTGGETSLQSFVHCLCLWHSLINHCMQ